MLLMLINHQLFAQQVIGTFPKMDGGFEGQTVGSFINAGSSSTPDSLIWTKSSSGSGSPSISTSKPRTGSKYAIFGNTFTTNTSGPRTFLSPFASVSANTSYVIQFYCKASNDTTFPNTTLSPGLSTASGTSPTYTTVSPSGNANAYTKYTVTVTTVSTTPSNGYSAFKIGSSTTNNGKFLDVDDWVVYAGNAADVTAPANPGNASAARSLSFNNAIDVNWGASSDVDGGGYLVVRYTVNPTSEPNPNANGIYAVGNTIGNGTIAYIGTATSFTDVSLTNNTTYYYRVYSVDKAFNYSSAYSTANVKCQTIYYLDAVAGNDNNNGSIASPWKNISKLNTMTLTPGTEVYLKCGNTWTGQKLKFNGSGTSNNYIIIDKYGTGSNPILAGNGITGEAVVYLYNQQYIEIGDLEITNSPNGPVNSDFFVGIYNDTAATNPNPLGADRRGVMVALDKFGTANHIYLRNLNIHHIKGQLGNATTALNGAIPKKTGGIFFTVLGNTETDTSYSRFNDVLIDSCNINYCENTGLAFDNEWNVYYPGGDEYNDWFKRRYSNVRVSNNIIHHIGKNAMIIRCTDETGLIERNVCYETALGTTGNTMFTARAKGTVFQYNEGYYNRSTTQTVDPGNIDGSMYDPDYGSIGIIFQYSYSHDNSEGIYWGCNTRGLNNNTTGIPDAQDTGCTLRYCVSQNDLGDLVYFNYASAGNEIYNNVFYIKSGLSPNIIHENSTKNHKYNFYNNIIYNLSSASSGADFAFASTFEQNRNISNNTFYGNHHSTEPADSFKLITNPNFLNPGSGGLGISTLNGYRLQSGSPAISSGRLITNNGGRDYFGNTVSSSSTPNRGIYQASGVVLSTPVVTSFTPTVGTTGTSINIKGSNFDGANLVRVGGVSVSSYNIVNDSTITAIIGTGATGVVRVANNAASGSSSSVFTFCNNSSSVSNVSSCSSYSWNGTTYTASGVYTYNTINANGCDSTATLNLTIKQPTSSVTNISACSSYTWNGLTYTATGTYTKVLTNAAGCDSTATLNLIIKQPTSSVTNISVCSSYSWNGLAYTATGTYTKVLTNAAGCDSTATLNLTIKQPTTSSTNISACSLYNWNGLTYTASGTYTKALTNAAGCDSTATLNLTIKKPTTSSTSVVECVSYFWNETTYTASGTYTKTLTNAAGCDSTATLNLTIKQPTISVTNISACSSYIWNGLTYTASGTYTKLLTNAAGCDSTATLNLTIKQPTTSTTNISGCSSYSWNGLTYTASGTYNKVLTNAAGCDSTATLNLTIKLPTTSNTIISNCVNYIWNGTTYTTSGSYTKLFTNAAGCDSIATLNLTIKQPTTSATNISACSSYNWNGLTYTASGTYTKTLINAAGCDSTATLNLTIKKPTTSSTSVVECVSYFWNETTYTASGTYTKTLTNSAGCDSTATLNLTIKQPTSSVTDISACSSYNWNGLTYTTSGTYTKLFTNSVGCDSTATLNLTIKQPTTSVTNISACSSYNWNGITYTASGTYSWLGVNVAGCDSTATLNLTIYSPSHHTENALACFSYSWNGTVYTSGGVYTYSYLNSNNCPSVDTLHLTILNNCHIRLSLKAYLQGYCDASGNMISTFYNLGMSNNTIAADSLQVNLWQPQHLNNPNPDYTVNALLQSNGSVSASMPISTYGNSYYIEIKHRNTMKTWSANTISINDTLISYDFTNAMNKAFANGLNLPMRPIVNNSYALYSGDINQDGAIDLLDMQIAENDAFAFSFGYNKSDCNGDGATDALDMQIIENNAIEQLYFASPQ